MKRRAARIVVLTVLLLVLTMLCACAAAVMISDGLRMEFIAALQQISFLQRVAVLVICVLFVALLAVYCILPITGKQAPDMLLKDEKGGSVSITAAALEKMAELAAKGVSGVRDVRVHVDTHDGQVSYNISVSVTHSAVVPDVVDKMQLRVMRYVSDRLGMQVSGVDVNVTGCVQDDTSTAVVTPRVK
jgi:uncharacterized alkaline shock family protein YloU